MPGLRGGLQGGKCNASGTLPLQSEDRRKGPFYGAVLDLTMHCLDHFAGDHKTFVEIMSEEESREIATREDNEIRKMVAAMERGGEVPGAHV